MSIRSRGWGAVITLVAALVLFIFSSSDRATGDGINPYSVAAGAFFLAGVLLLLSFLSPRPKISLADYLAEHAAILHCAVLEPKPKPGLFLADSARKYLHMSLREEQHFPYGTGLGFLRDLPIVMGEQQFDELWLVGVRCEAQGEPWLYMGLVGIQHSLELDRAPIIRRLAEGTCCLNDIGNSDEIFALAFQDMEASWEIRRGGKG